MAEASSAEAAAAAAPKTEEEVAALRLEPANAALLASIAELGSKIVALKEAGAAGKEVSKEADELAKLKGQLPLELMTERDRKNFLKKQEKAAAKAAKAGAAAASASSAAAPAPAPAPAMATAPKTEEEVAALRLEPANAALLASIAELSSKIAELKEAGAAGKEVSKQADELAKLKAQLPLELMNERDRKNFLKKREKASKAAKAAQAKADRAAKFEGGKNAAKAEKKAAKMAIATGTEFVNTTPAGEKKDLSATMAAGYEPPAVEAAWDAWWEQSGFYTADVDAALAATPEERFVMVIPPPNVTGSLHIGHALTCAIEDTLARWHRMTGKHVMWLPGTDHAGIATQAVVEKKLMKEQQLTRHDLGREKFIEKVMDWKDASGARILTQQRRLAASVDHSRTVFTMDEPRKVAVTEAFVQMYDDGLIYRDTRLVNWSHALCTALSDIEVDHVDLKGRTLRSVVGHDPSKQYEFGTLTTFAYLVADAEGKATAEEIVVATTRLETMLGDSAVAIHPDDPRYAHLHGKSVVHPFRGCTIPIICDGEVVDMAFGTGAVKITPAHDPNDYKCGRRHGLPELSVLNDDGSINGICGAPFEGVMRYDGRELVEEQLRALGLFKEKTPHEMQLPVCSRSGDIIEPRLKPQWWASCKEMAAMAVDAVESGALKLVPKAHEKTWFHWLNNIQDWCVSRQLWWGHRIPAYKVVAAGVAAGEGKAAGAAAEEVWVVGRSEEEARGRAAAKLGVDAATVELAQDEDVLDTWFSSGLFPFAVFGWMQEGEMAKKEQAAFFPGTLLETGHDIIFFWVARMVMMSLQLRKTLPFKTVYFHAMVRDKYGRKMSKSLGNVVDPISVIEGISLEGLHETLLLGNLPPKEVEKAKAGQKLDYPDGIPQCGADALRFGLLACTLQDRDVNLDINNVAAYRRFCNKLWNLAKFLLMNLGDDFRPDPAFLVKASGAEASGAEVSGAEATALPLSARDRWILSCLGEAAVACNVAFGEFHFAAATTAVHTFFLKQLCDVYVEAVKPVMMAAAKPDAAPDALAAREAARNVLWWSLDVALRLVHPIMPFLSEELWQRLPGRPQPAPTSVMVAHYPGADPVARHAGDAALEAETAALRALRDPQADAAYELCCQVAAGMRALATEFQNGFKKGGWPDLAFHVHVRVAPQGGTPQGGTPQGGAGKLKLEMLRGVVPDLCVLGKGKTVTVEPAGEAAPPPQSAVNVLDQDVEVFLELGGILDTKKEVERLGKELAKTQLQVAGLEKRVANPNYDKMPQPAKDKLSRDIGDLTAKAAVLETQRKQFEDMILNE